MSNVLDVSLSSGRLLSPGLSPASSSGAAQQTGPGDLVRDGRRREPRVPGRYPSCGGKDLKLDGTTFKTWWLCVCDCVCLCLSI